ncbi:hypothetical protein QYE76_029986 [Lolium multiflorum]|uniref:Uncharacterized protein n=1 Tax=Lolium multiflorum TaxID=4521 RepID=A0AAD8QSI6_LOLMU|nr:hypothetical protein QYE76_029986 [Lolium multiflorum]
MQVEAPGNSNAPDQQEAVGDSDALGQEESGDKEESILGNLSPISDDASSIGTKEYNRLTKELEIGENADDASSMNTEEYDRALKELGGGSPLSRERPHEEYLSPEEIVDQAGLDAIAHSDILKREREVDESLEKVKQLRKHWEAKMSEAQKDADRIRWEAIPCKITFATPTEQQPLTTPKDNMKKAVELLKKKDEQIDIPQQ